MKVKYILRQGNEFYAGNTYIHQGEYFAAYTKRDGAKRYTTEARAKSAAEKLLNKVGYSFHVEEVIE
jgi:hypothetical protein